VLLLIGATIAQGAALDSDFGIRKWDFDPAFFELDSDERELLLTDATASFTQFANSLAASREAAIPAVAENRMVLPLAERNATNDEG
jgi:hypothetical protein